MEELLIFLNQPVVLWSLFGGSVLLVLIDYLFPVDWPAFLGYLCFAIFIGATVDLPASWSLFAMFAVFSLLLTLHRAFLSKFLTNAPHVERRQLLRHEEKATEEVQELRNQKPTSQRNAQRTVNASSTNFNGSHRSS